MYWFLFLITKRRRENIYCDGRGKIFNSMNKFVHESLLIQLNIILIFFCNLNIFTLSVEWPQNDNS